MKFNIEFGDIIILEASNEGRLELTLSNGFLEDTTVWLDAFQVDKLIMELKILKDKKLIKYPDERTGEA